MTTNLQVAALTNEQIIEIAARLGSLSLNVTRVHEIGGKTTTVFDDAGLTEFAAAVLSAAPASERAADDDSYTRPKPKQAFTVNATYVDAGKLTPRKFSDEAQSSGGEASEREAFEAHMRSVGETYLYRRDMTGCERFGDYCRENVQDQWVTWQARAALTTDAARPTAATISEHDAKGLEIIAGWMDKDGLIEPAAMLRRLAEGAATNAAKKGDQ